MKQEILISFENAKKAEPIIRKFIFENSNFVKYQEMNPIIIGPLTIIRKKKRTSTEKMELTDELRQKIDKEGLFFDYPNSQLFKNIEDPVFYNNDEIIGKIITHEPIIYLYLTPSEKIEFEKQGAKFD
jgi:hypothetical protein